MNLTARLAHDLTLKGGIALRLMSTAGDKSVRLVAAFATFGTRRVYQSGARKVRPAGRGRPRPRSTAGHAPVPRATAAAAAKRRRARKPRGDTSEPPPPSPAQVTIPWFETGNESTCFAWLSNI